MAWFVPDTIEFLRELELNNDREWFAANKKRYEKSVKGPMVSFAGELIERMKAIDPSITMDAKESVFRIHRDTRFSKNKAPYKTHAALVVAPGQKGEHSRIGLYFHIDPRKMGIASGLYMPDTAQLRSVRTHIAANLDEFERLIQDPAFVEAFGTVQGDRNKIVPPEFKDAVARQPLLLNKQFFYWSEDDAEEATREDLADYVMGKMHAATPINRFLLAGMPK